LLSADEWCDGIGAQWKPEEEREFALNCFDQLVRVFESHARLLATLEGGFDGHGWADYADSVAYSPDGSRLIATGNDGNIRIWDTDGYRLIKTINVSDIPPISG
jgi:WD40 repeat protein